MRNLHYALMGVMLTLVLGVAVGFLQPWGGAATAQHGAPQHGHAAPQDGDDLHAHFAAVVERLELTEAQRETLSQPLADAFAAMQELHRLHAVIEAELTEEQAERLESMMHSMMGGMAGERHGSRHQEHGARAPRH